MRDKAVATASASDAKSRHDTADYIGAMTGELAKMAQAKDFEILAYLLEIAELEARTQAGTRPPEH